jgi:hypothetical protein
MADNYTHDEIDFLRKQREKGRTWSQITDLFNKRFNADRSQEALRLKYGAEKNAGEVTEIDLSLAKQNRTIRQTNHRLRQEANAAIDALNLNDAILDEFKELLKTWKAAPTPTRKITIKDGKKKNAKMELLLSDLHIGQETPTFNFEVARRRLAEIREVWMFEIGKAANAYNIKKLIIGMLGDIINSYEFHGLASAITSEDVTPVQMVQAIEMIFAEVVRPVAKLGYPIEVVGVAGNHDRVQKERHVYRVGQESLTYVMYKMLEMLCQTSGLTNVTFNIPRMSYGIADIFGYKALYTHGDASGLSLNRKAVEGYLADRQSQLNAIVTFIRMAHFHEFSVFGRGRAICNGTLVSDDGFADELGYRNEPGQAISCYVETNKRKTPFYWSYLVSVEGIK